MSPANKPEEPTANVSKQWITPTLAAGWLAKNTKNRPVRQSVVLKYAADIQAHNWRLNGATIVMSDKGNILDGQHRLLACIQAGEAFETFVASGVDEEAFVTIDSGTSRKFSDVLNILGYPDPTRLSALTRGWWEYTKRGKLGTTGKEQTATNQELKEWLNDNSEVLLGCLHGISPAMRLLRGSTAAWGVAWIACGVIEETDRDFFFERLKDGQNLAEGDAIFALRRLLQEKEGLFAPNLMLAYLIKGWNKFRARENILVISVRASEAMPEPM